MTQKVQAHELALVSPGTKDGCNDIDSKAESEDQPFDWYNDPSIIVHDQAAIAAYYNPAEELVIKQRDTLGYPESTIFVAPENVEKFLQGLRERAGPRKKLRVVDGGAE
jgi:hypothetical protein